MQNSSEYWLIQERSNSGQMKLKQNKINKQNQTISKRRQDKQVGGGAWTADFLPLTPVGPEVVRTHPKLLLPLIVAIMSNYLLSLFLVWA